MASKKEDEGFSFRKFLGEVGSAVLGEGVRSVAEEIKEKVEETMQSAQERVKETVKHAIKALTLFLIILMGFIFVLVGLGKYLSETVASLRNGLGFVVVGLALVLLGLFANWMSK